jgi:uncharacterized membrane protein
MGTITGERSVEIDAPRQQCFDIAADLENAPRWQSTLTSVDVLERDADGRPALVETVSDAKVKAIRSRLRFRYDAPDRIACEQEHGDLKSMRGTWTFTDLGGGRTRTTYALEADPGRMLGLLLRGPAEEKIRDLLLSSAVDGLKTQAEQGR